MYLVLDALDESPDRREFLTLLMRIQSWRIDHLHLLVTSREERDIEDELSHLVTHDVPMTESLIDGDIRIHVSNILGHASAFQMFSEEEKNMIETTLTEGAHGM